MSVTITETGIEIEVNDADFSACLRNNAIEMAIGRGFAGRATNERWQGYESYEDLTITLDDAARLRDWLTLQIVSSGAK